MAAKDRRLAMVVSSVWKSRSDLVNMARRDVTAVTALRKWRDRKPCCPSTGPVRNLFDPIVQP